MAVEVYGIDQARIAVDYPQVEVSATAVITAANVLVLLDEAASHVNGILIAHGFTPSDIAADSGSETFTICVGLVLTSLKPIFDRVLERPQSVIQASIDARDAALDAIQRLPQTLGSEQSGLAPRTETSTEYLEITISSDNRKTRRSFGAGWNGF